MTDNRASTGHKGFFSRIRTKRQIVTDSVSASSANDRSEKRNSAYKVSALSPDKSAVSKVKKRNYPKAFQGDTYVADLQKASKAGKSWTWFLFAVVVISAAADFYLLEDAFAWMLGVPSLFEFQNFLSALPSACICVALVALYLTFCCMAGKKYAEYKIFRAKSSLAIVIFLALVVVVVLVFISLVRYYSMLEEIGSVSQFAQTSFSGAFGTSAASNNLQQVSAGELTFPPPVDVEALVRTFGTIAVMVFGALLEMLNSYYSYDPYASEKKRLAQAHISEDKSLYAQVFSQYVNSEKSLKYEERERELDKATVKSIFRVSALSAQLNSIVDPADAYDFIAVSKELKKVHGS